MRLGASRRHLQRRPPDRGTGPLLIAAQEGHLEVVEAGAARRGRLRRGEGSTGSDYMSQFEIVDQT